MNKNLLKAMIAIMLLFVLASVLLFHYLLKTSQQIHDIELNNTKYSHLNDLSSCISEMMDHAQDYILYSDQHYLDEFQKYSSLALQKELELNDSLNSFYKQNMTELIELNKSYISFMEKEAIPLIQAKSYTQEDLKYIHLRNQQFTQEIEKKLNMITVTTSRNMDDSIKNTILQMNERILLALFILLMLLLLMPWLFYTLFKPILVQRLYLSRLSEQIQSASIFMDRKGVVRHINRAAQELFDILPESVLQKNVQEFPSLFPKLQGITQPLLHARVREKSFLGQQVSFNRDGRTIEMVIDYIPLFLFNRLSGVMLVANLAHRQKEKPLLLDTLEKERKRISIEIHDWIGRYMSTIIHSLDYILRLNKNSGLKPELLDSLMNLRSHCQNAAIEMRGIMNDIHPYLIDKVGLISALESYIATFEELNNIKVYIFYQDRALRIKKKDQIIIYRIIQESLTNIAKHAKASEVDIVFTVDKDQLKIEVVDNGGAGEEFAVGNGLWGMKERAHLIGGNVVFASNDSGFSVMLTVPIPGGQDDEKNQDHVD
ncbi:ATP-binding protein [Desulforamulus ruminis]|uniref:histidine kinase n=1 Tax=Desulforamulus ruminis (strain ATCC 23193 / DSM 2154 / NCIMB 8452 / DL) TaxID=696281 RepID=F6DVC1_DESRL|nr:ATP-binding protein [Desulforamulus ruminis]AEG60274.1 PAS sensor protein [Desulforamulus ruminis DSM 2154]